MTLAGLDIATTTGMCIVNGDEFRVSSFRPREKRPEHLGKGEIDFAYEGRVVRAFRDWLRPALVSEGVRVVGIEQPLRSDVTFRKPVVNEQASWAGQSLTYKNVGGTTMSVVFRLYGLTMAALEICARLGIDVEVLAQSTWRSAFLGVTRAPKNAQNGRQWLKAEARKRCEQLGVVVRNDDQAEAVGVAWALRARRFPAQATLPGELFHEKMETVS